MGSAENTSHLPPTASARRAKEKGRYLTVAEAFEKYPVEEEEHKGMLENMVAPEDVFFVGNYYKLVDADKISICSELSYNYDRPIVCNRDMLKRYHALAPEKKAVVDDLLGKGCGNIQ